MADGLDLKVSRKLQKILRRVQDVVRKEVGEEMGIALVLFPWAEGDEPDQVGEYQYVSNAPRSHMQGALRSIVAKWDAGQPDTPPHLRQ
ncbi:MAG TPA: hypothetical protein VD932_03775 [Aquabacterium sp.]|nr:hypothetical protein [Aquabacterium sp.]